MSFYLPIVVSIKPNLSLFFSFSLHLSLSLFLSISIALAPYLLQATPLKSTCIPAQPKPSTYINLRRSDSDYTATSQLGKSPMSYTAI